MSRASSFALLMLAVLASCSNQVERTNPFDAEGGSSTLNSNASFQPFMALRAYLISSVPVPSTNMVTNYNPVVSNGVTNMVTNIVTNTYRDVPTNVILTTGGRASEIDVPSGFLSSMGERWYTLSEDHFFVLRYQNPNVTLERFPLGFGSSTALMSFTWNVGSVGMSPYFRFIPGVGSGRVWITTNSNTLVGFDTNTLQPGPSMTLPTAIGESELYPASLWFDGSNAFYFSGSTIMRVNGGAIVWTNRVLAGGFMNKPPKLAWNGGTHLVALTEYGEDYSRSRALLVNAATGALAASVYGVGDTFTMGGLRLDANRPVSVEVFGGVYVYITAAVSGSSPRFLRNATGTNRCDYLTFSPPLGSESVLVLGAPGLLAQPYNNNGRNAVRYWKAVNGL